MCLEILLKFAVRNGLGLVVARMANELWPKRVGTRMETMLGSRRKGIAPKRWSNDIRRYAGHSPIIAKFGGRLHASRYGFDGLGL